MNHFSCKETQKPRSMQLLVQKMHEHGNYYKFHSVNLRLHIVDLYVNL
jgi:hypothetical protein